MTEQVKTFEIKELLSIFRDGLITLIPIAERADIIWSGPDVYDPWEEMSEGLFSGIVTSVMYNLHQFSIESVPKYDFTIPNYRQSSFITCPNAPGNNAFLSLKSIVSPFDHATLLLLEDDLSSTDEFVDVSFERADFALSALERTTGLRSMLTTLRYT